MEIIFKSVSVGTYAQHIEKGVESLFQKPVESQFFSFELLPQRKVVGMKYFAEFLRFRDTEKSQASVMLWFAHLSKSKIVLSTSINIVIR